ncbi:hypothetical protein [Mucilaginibacter sp. OK098]|uniref:hypothetical protein n=1 Tax=Mucilaginibacter sp. OK098 TaxID=1855297 RepID=UPI000919C494|nr:hypothetical protein [Mucilaginibacter sp. OK098]SHL97001.1 hypothetical protein SAMN05216524_101364 [Mucilaginibacter sp. OK098]
MRDMRFIYGMPARLATGLNRRTQYWNKASKLVALGVFVLLLGGGSVYLIVKAIWLK